MEYKTLYKIYIYQKLIIGLLLIGLPSYGATHKTYTPVEALARYFPSPALIRCLNHSNIPEQFRKVLISRYIKFPKKPEEIENILIGVNSKKFAFSGNLIAEGETKPLKVRHSPYFGFNKGGKIQQSLFGLEDFLNLQKKVYITDMVGNQNLNFETFLKTTKGKIGNVNYNLELTGEDKASDNGLKYFINGSGMIGEENITVKGTSTDKDSYELYETLGHIEIYTKVKVYD